MTITEQDRDEIGDMIAAAIDNLADEADTRTMQIALIEQKVTAIEVGLGKVETSIDKLATELRADNKALNDTVSAQAVMIEKAKNAATYLAVSLPVAAAIIGYFFG